MEDRLDILIEQADDRYHYDFCQLLAMMMWSV